jgi:hypothetical protein
MDFNFSKEILFVGGFIIILVLFIQYMMYSNMKKYVKQEISKIVIRTNKPSQNNIMQNRTTVGNNKNQNQNQNQNQNKVQKDDDTYEVDTPEDEKKKKNITKDSGNDDDNDNDDNDNDDNDNDDNDNDDDADADSYVNPIHSEKNIDDDS